MQPAFVSHNKSYFSIEQLDARMKEVAKGNAETEAAIKKVLPSKFWQFILMNGGLNGKMTEYFGDYTPDRKLDLDGDQIPPIDHWYLQTPIPQAYRETVQNCRKALVCKAQQSKGECKIASIACGTLFDVARANYPAGVNVKIYGFDADPESLALAGANLKQSNLEGELQKKDAWEPIGDKVFDAVVCNGFTFYIDSDERIVELFRIAHASLKEGGIFCASFMHPADQWQNSDWKASDAEGSQLLDKLKPIPRKWTAKFRSSEQMTALLKRAGFTEVKIDLDRRHIHSLAIATKA